MTKPKKKGISPLLLATGTMRGAASPSPSEMKRERLHARRHHCKKGSFEKNKTKKKPLKEVRERASDAGDPGNT